MADQDAAAFCADLVRALDFPRYASTLFLPSVHRRPMLAIHAFNVEISRVRDQVSQPLPGQIRLQWWTDLLASEDHGGTEVWLAPAELRAALRALHVTLDTMQTGPAIRTYNIMMGERRRVAAALVAVP